MMGDGSTPPWISCAETGLSLAVCKIFHATFFVFFPRYLIEGAEVLAPFRRIVESTKWIVKY